MYCPINAIKNVVFHTPLEIPDAILYISDLDLVYVCVYIPLCHVMDL